MGNKPMAHENNIRGFLHLYSYTQDKTIVERYSTVCSIIEDILKHTRHIFYTINSSNFLHSINSLPALILQCKNENVYLWYENGRLSKKWFSVMSKSKSLCIGLEGYNFVKRFRDKIFITNTRILREYPGLKCIVLDIFPKSIKIEHHLTENCKDVKVMPLWKPQRLVENDKIIMFNNTEDAFIALCIITMYIVIDYEFYYHLLNDKLILDKGMIDKAVTRFFGKYALYNENWDDIKIIVEIADNEFDICIDLKERNIMKGHLFTGSFTLLNFEVGEMYSYEEFKCIYA